MYNMQPFGQEENLYQADVYVTDMRDPSPRIPSSSNKNCRYRTCLQKFIDEEIYLLPKALLILLDHVKFKIRKTIMRDPFCLTTDT